MKRRKHVGLTCCSNGSNVILTCQKCGSVTHRLWRKGGWWVCEECRSKS